MTLAWLPALVRRAGSRAAAAAPQARASETSAPDVVDTRDVLQHAIDLARDGMAIFDRDMRLVAWNRPYRDLFRFPDALMQPGVALEALARFNAARGLYGPGPVEVLVVERMAVLAQPSDTRRLDYAPYGRVLELRSVRLRDGGLFFTYADATALAASEEENEAERQTLERRVRERTEELELLNLELAQAKAEAEDANVSKTRFLAAASHDLLQPLNAARLYVTSLRERMNPALSGTETARLAANVDASLEAVEDILAALLEITHLDAGATRVELGAVSVASLLRQLAIDFAPAAAKRKLRFVVVPTEMVVLSDRRLLRRLMQNLVSNALKYTVRGGVLVGARRVGDTGVRLDVIDTGCGIPESKQRLIFREFERLPLPDADETPGAGLGLSIVERLAHVLGHAITLSSEVGRGSRFSVGVPRVILEPSAAAAVVAAPVARQRSLDGLVVAAVDNEVPILRGMETLLRGWDCNVATGTDLAEVEGALRTIGAAPDVVVADYHIGGGTDGLGVIAALRRAHGALPAVLITADRSVDLRMLASQADVRVLMKPLKPAALRSLLSQWRLLRSGAT